jgi:hypothetical protein
MMRKVASIRVADNRGEGARTKGQEPDSTRSGTGDGVGMASQPKRRLGNSSKPDSRYNHHAKGAPTSWVSISIGKRFILS